MKDIIKYLTLICIMSFVFTIAGCGSDTPPDDSAISAATPTSANNVPPSIVSSPKGEVLVKLSGSDTWTTATAGMKVEEGDSIKTGGDGTALLIFFEGSVMEIGVGSEIVIEELDRSVGTVSTTIKLRQMIGKTISRVEQLVDPASGYEVSTPAGVIAVRGTVFKLQVEADGYTEVTCEAGQLSFTAAGITVVVQENMTSSASVGSTPSTPLPGRTSTPGPTSIPIATPTTVATPTAEPTPNPDIVHFLDANLEAVVREAIGKTGGDITKSDLEGITNLSADSRDISYLNGLEYCPNLSVLYLRGNQVLDLSPLSSLINLTDLRLRGNGLGDLSPLSNLTNIQILDLNDNQISDIASLTSLVNLEGLGLGGNQISDISPLESGLNLGYLELQNNQITDIYPLYAAALNSTTDCEGCYLDLTGNPLNTTSINAYIPQLRQMGIEVVY